METPTLASKCRWCNREDGGHTLGCPGLTKVIPIKHPSYRLVKCSRGGNTWFRIDYWNGEWGVVMQDDNEQAVRQQFAYLTSELKEEILEEK